MKEKKLGKIKTLRNGYGFIKSGNNDFYFNFDRVEKNILSELKEGLEVEFFTEPGKGGKPSASKVWLKGNPPAAAPHPRPIEKPKREVNQAPDHNYFLPLDTEKLIQEMKPGNVDNYSLLLNKVARTIVDRGKEKFVLAERGKPICHLSSASLADALKALHKRQSKSVQASGHSEQFKLRPDWRLVIGLGSASVYETSLTLHHVYGFPYLPATSLKGVTRSHIINCYFAGIEGNKEKGALADPGFCRIFGCPETSIKGELMGAVRFYDAYPIDTPVIKCDVMNPHYAPYYSEGKAPVDFHSPVPIQFLTVEETAFWIWITSDSISPIHEGVFDGKTPLEVVSEWLPKALREHGIGAKTSVGYGSMTYSKNI